MKTLPEKIQKTIQETNQELDFQLIQLQLLVKRIQNQKQYEALNGLNVLDEVTNYEELNNLI